MHDEMQVALAKGCLAGLALALVFFLIGGLLFLAARSFGLEHGVSLAIGIGGGPVIVSAAVLGAIVLRAQARSVPSITQADDATASRDDP